MALLEFLAAAARARIVATHILQRVAYRLLVSVTAVRAVDMTMVVIVVLMLVIVIAIRAVDMGLLGHAVSLRNNFGGNYLAFTLQVHVMAQE